MTNYSAILVATVVLPGSKLAARSDPHSRKTRAVVDALKPKLTSDKQAATITVIKAALDAAADVTITQAALDAADAAKKPELEGKLKRDMYAADVALEVAGLPPKYSVTAP